MKLSRLIFTLILLSAGLAIAHAQPEIPSEPPEIEVKVYRGWYKFVDSYGDTVRMYEFKERYVYNDLKFKNDKEREAYDKLVRDVKKTLPYAKAACTALMETYEYIQSIPDQKKREAHLKTLEKDIVAQYKPSIMKMTKSQGKVLLKLINRETAQSSYNIVKAFLGSFRAAFWQTFGRFFGMNMKGGFDPDKNKEDGMIDRIATLVEQGSL